MTVDIPTQDAESVATAIYHLADHYRRDTKHDPEDVESLQRAADRLDQLADDILERLERIRADYASAKLQFLPPESP